MAARGQHWLLYQWHAGLGSAAAVVAQIVQVRACVGDAIVAQLRRLCRDGKLTNKI